VIGGLATGLIFGGVCGHSIFAMLTEGHVVMGLIIPCATLLAVITGIATGCLVFDTMAEIVKQNYHIRAWRYLKSQIYDLKADGRWVRKSPKNLLVGVFKLLVVLTSSAFAVLATLLMVTSWRDIGYDLLRKIPGAYDWGCLVSANIIALGLTLIARIQLSVRFMSALAATFMDGLEKFFKGIYDLLTDQPIARANFTVKYTAFKNFIKKSCDTKLKTLQFFGLILLHLGAMVLIAMNVWGTSATGINSSSILDNGKLFEPGVTVGSYTARTMALIVVGLFSGALCWDKFVTLFGASDTSVSEERGRARSKSFIPQSATIAPKPRYAGSYLSIHFEDSRFDQHQSNSNMAMAELYLFDLKEAKNNYKSVLVSPTFSYPLFEQHSNLLKSTPYPVKTPENQIIFDINQSVKAVH